MGKIYDHIKLLLWKNWLLQLRSPVQTIFEILAPVLVCLILVFTRIVIRPEKFKELHFAPFNATKAQIMAIMKEIAYSPTNKNLEDLVRNAGRELGITVVRSFHNSKSMVSHLLKKENEVSTLDYTLAGIQFDDSLSDMSELPTTIHAALRFPPTMRIVTDNIWTWRTFAMFPRFQIPGPRRNTSLYTASPDYYQEGFLGLQLALTKAIMEVIKTKSNTSFNATNILMQRFPYPAWTHDDYMFQISDYHGMVIMLCFYVSIIFIVKVITVEKERQLKEAMKIMGLTAWYHWVAWFLKSVAFLMISVILMVILLKTPWYGEYSVFTTSNGFIIFFFLMIYVIAAVTFCFMMSSFFSTANLAVGITALAVFLSYVPYMLTIESRYQNQIRAKKILLCFLFNSAGALGFRILVMYEAAGEGIQWSTIAKPVTVEDNVAMSDVMLMLIVDTILHLVMALYIEAVFPGKYGIPQIWYFPFTSSFWCRKPHQSISIENIKSIDSTSLSGNEHFEKAPENLSVGIQMKHLRKEFKETVAVKDLTLNMYENQITVLLGHNGAGKTTTMSMLTGIHRPTEGTAFIGGYDIRTDMDKARESLGFCPQYNVLYDKLTVKEHLYFFSKLKGVEESRTDDEIHKYITLLELNDKRYVKSCKLSGGMKRKLCVGIAFCGNSKVVMLDEPTSGMDPSARRALWDLVRGQKNGRTILLTTHFMDEADLLGDRIAIMVSGVLECYGSSFFLKKKFGAGYHIILEKNAKCNSEAVTDLLRHYVPDIKVEYDVGAELSYCLKEEQSQVFEKMLRDLESRTSTLGIESYGISLTTMEEVFSRVGESHAKRVPTDNAEDHGQEVLEDDNAHEMVPEQTDSKLLVGCALCCNQILAMLMKRMLSLIRVWYLLIIGIVVAVIFSVCTFYDVTLEKRHQFSHLPELPLTLSLYHKPITVVNGSNNMYKKKYTEFLNENHYENVDWNQENLTDNILKKGEADIHLMRNNYLIGASFRHDNTVTAWFNNEPFHTPPLSLAMAFAAILDAHFSTKYTVNITNYPLPFYDDPKMLALEETGFTFGCAIGLGMTVVSAFYLLFPIKERVIRSKHLQYIAGVEWYTYWSISYFCDMVSFLITGLCVIVCIIPFQHDGFKTAGEMSRLIILFFCFILAVLPLQYLASFCFNTPATGFLVMVLLGMLAGCCCHMYTNILYTNNQEKFHVYYNIFLISPYYCLSTGIENLYVTYARYRKCSDLIAACLMKFEVLNEEQCHDLSCLAYKTCCGEIKEDYYKWYRPGISKNIVYFLVMAVVLILTLVVIEMGIFKRMFSCNIASDLERDPSTDSDVLAEKQHIKDASKEELADYALVLKNLTKYYKELLAVNEISIGVSSYECFGLLGENGAGKTTTFKMMTGEIQMSFGEVWFNGLNLQNDRRQVRQYIGYCPQFDALLDNLTGYETLIIYGLLKGIPFKRCKLEAKHLSQEFDFHQHLHKRVYQYSGGNKRKLSTAIAVIGEPRVVFLDEPTAGMDPDTRRYLWNVLCKVRASGKCIILTSHSMEECEALCTKLAIMVHGSMRCLGSIQHLKNKFSQGYTLVIKVRQTDSDVDLCYSKVEEFVANKFRGSILRERHEELLTYHIKETSVPLSKMFGIMEKAKKDLPIEDYSISQSSLEQIFLMCIKHQASNVNRESSKRSSIRSTRTTDSRRSAPSRRSTVSATSDIYFL